MLQIPNPSSLKKGLLRNSLTGLSLNYNDFVPGTDAHQQYTVIHDLKKTIDNEHFYFSIDLKNKSVNFCNGVNQWLGYSNAQFTLKKYNEIIHPSHSAVQSFYGAAMLELLLQERPKLAFMEAPWVSMIALQHKNGNYLYCKRDCYPFQVTKNNLLQEYLCHFTILKAFDNECYHTRLYSGGGGIETAEEKIRKHVKRKFEAHSSFSVQELRILKRYAQNKTSTSGNIAKAFKIEPTTVNTYNKRILRKAETLFETAFDNAKTVAETLHRTQLI